MVPRCEVMRRCWYGAAVAEGGGSLLAGWHESGFVVLLRDTRVRGRLRGHATAGALSAEGGALSPGGDAAMEASMAGTRRASGWRRAGRRGADGPSRPGRACSGWGPRHRVGSGRGWSLMSAAVSQRQRLKQVLHGGRTRANFESRCCRMVAPVVSERNRLQKR